MSIIEELQKQLSETRESVEQVVKDLNEYSQIKESLQSADRGISAASSNLDALSEGLKQSTEYLNSATLKLGEVVEILKNTDPAEVLKGQRKLEDVLQEVGGKIDEVSRDGEKLRERVNQLPDESSVNVKHSEIITAIQKTGEATSANVSSSVNATTKIVEGLAGKFTPIVVGIVINIALLVYIISKL
jgi:chromosome segregation ATPase